MPSGVGLVDGYAAGMDSWAHTFLDGQVVRSFWSS